MAQVINLEGLPDPVAKAIAETVLNLKVHYGAKGVGSKPPRKLTAADADQALEELLDTLPPMPSLSDEALSRESIYTLDDDAR
jgi:hypothetical protein